MAASTGAGDQGVDDELPTLQASLYDPFDNDFASLVFRVGAVRAQFALYRQDWDITRAERNPMGADKWKELLTFCDDYYTGAMRFGGAVARSLGSGSSIRQSASSINPDSNETAPEGSGTLGETCESR